MKLLLLSMNQLYKSMPILLALALVLNLNSCANIEKHEPELIPVTGEVELPTSNINVPLVLEMQALEDLVNEKVDGEIYKDDSFEGDNLIMSVSKIGRIEVNLIGNKLYYKLPLNIWLEGRFEKKLIGKSSIKKSQKLDFSLVLHFKTSLDVNQDWRAVIHTALLKYEWVKTPKIKVAFVNIPITGLVENQLDKNMPSLLAKIDASVHEKLDLKSKALQLWTGIQKPIRVNKKVKDAWLLASPERIYMSHINGKNGLLMINMRLEATITTVVGDSPTVALHTELPPLLFHNDTSGQFNLYVKSTLPFKELNEALAEQVGKKTLAWENYQINLKKFTLMGSDSQLVLKLGVSGDVAGDIYFRGKPHYDSLSQYLFLSNFDFDVSSEETLLNTADWLLHDEVRNKVQEELKMPLGDKLSKLPKLIQNAIDGSKVSDKINIRLDSLQFNPSQILITSENAQILVHAAGNVHVEIEKLQ